MTPRGRLVLLAAALLPCMPAAAAAQTSALAVPTSLTVPNASQAASSILARVRPSVVQIRGFFGDNAAKAFHGTAFAIAPGLFVTNYHVISEKVQHPDRYRLEYQTPDGQTGSVTVRAVDVSHDLAVVSAEGYAPVPLAVATAPLTKGDRAYAIGFPLDVGLTITEGISNGLVEDSFNPRIHYSGAVNGGMSGGPALNAAGELIGINVSGYIFQQLVSFLVPAVHVLPLVEKARDAEAPSAEALKAEVGGQMRAHAASLIAALSGPITTAVTSGYALPAKLAPFVDCNANGSVDATEPVQSVRIGCSAKAGLYLQQGLYSGDIRFSHTVLSTSKLGAWRFAKKLSGQSIGGSYGSKRHVAPFACETHNVALTGFDARTVLCVRAYRKQEGLYDLTLRVTSLDATSAGFASQLDMFGFEYDAALGFARRYLAAMERRP